MTDQISVLVLHARDMGASYFLEVADLPKDAEAARKGWAAVATVAVGEIGEVFRATNHIEHDWTQNPEITAVLAGDRVRSTSVGDLYLHREAGGTPVLTRVSSFSLDRAPQDVADAFARGFHSLILFGDAAVPEA